MNSVDVLVTGASGYLGRHLLGALARARLGAAALVRDPTRWHAQDWLDEVGPVHLVPAPLCDPDAVVELTAGAGIKTIFHLAAEVRHSRIDTEAMARFNVHGTASMVRVARALGARLVFVSSSGTVGCFASLEERADESAPYSKLSGRWPYYESKSRAEREARRLADALGVELVIVRPPALLGPQDHRYRSTQHVSWVLERRLPVVPTGGMHFTDVRDAACALVRLAQVTHPRPIYHLPGQHSTLAAFFQQVGDLARVPLTRRRAPTWLLLGAAHCGERWSRWTGAQRPRWLPDPVVVEMSECFWGLASSFSHAELGYKPRPPDETLLDTIEWMRSQRRPRG